MTVLDGIYKCELCGNIAQVLHTGAGALVCCGQEMQKMDEKTADAATEKHVPVIEKTATGITVKVGSVPHPMEDDHFIEWIELIADGKSYRQRLQPGAPAEATFCVEAADVSARELCNKHGLWKG
jgi:superoxide reductase